MAEFVSYPSVVDQFRMTANWKQFYLKLLKSGDKCQVPSDRLVSEYKWWEAGRPYYSCYPAVTPMLTKLDLDKIPMTSVTVPHDSFLVRLREDDPMIQCGGGKHCKTILFSNLSLGNRKMWSVMATLCAPGQTINGSQLFLALYRVQEGITLGDAHTMLVSKMEQDVAEEGIAQILKLVCTICMLGEDQEFVKRDILAKDRDAYDELDADDPRRKTIEDRAARRGKNGFCIGRVIESSPHWRNPHPCLVHTGEGGKIPKVIFRRGCVVNNKKLATVPSEYMGNDPNRDDKQEAGPTENGN